MQGWESSSSTRPAAYKMQISCSKPITPCGVA